MPYESFATEQQVRIASVEYDSDSKTWMYLVHVQRGPNDELTFCGDDQGFSHEYVIRRRFNEFKQLHAAMAPIMGDALTPLPSDGLMTLIMADNEALLTTRKQVLEQILLDILHHTGANELPEVLAFLGHESISAKVLPPMYTSMGHCTGSIRKTSSPCWTRQSLAEHAGHVIREVVRVGGDLGLVNKDDTIYDPQTVADRRSQQRIIYALRHVWPQLQVVGEEGDLEAPDAQDVVQADTQALASTLNGIAQAALPMINNKDLVLWIDPLDGTKKFASQEYEEVSVLIGIAVNKRPIAGVMHLPFHGDHGVTFWGGPGIGLFRTEHGATPATNKHTPVSAPATTGRALILTHSGTNCELVNRAVEQLSPAQVLLGGATGTMALTVLKGESDGFFRFRDRTKRWDICAVEPLLEAVGGSIVDKYGRVYEYDPHGDPSYDNAHGLVVTTQASIQKLLLDTMSKINMLRTLEGQPFTCNWISAHLLNNAPVASFSVISASHGKQSAVARLVVEMADGSAPRQLFLKRYVQSELPSRSKAHWTRDLYSYQTEARFYRDFYARLTNLDVPLVRPIAVLSAPDPDPSVHDSTALLLALEDLTGPEYEQPDRLNLEDTKKALEFLALLHAAGHRSVDLRQEIGKQLWASAGWWSLAKRGLDELRQAPSVWGGVMAAFMPEWIASGVELSPQQRALGQRVVDNGQYVTDALWKDTAALQTIVHGDFKSANLFFHTTTSSRTVLAFDWQWCGLGLGALDVANLLNTSVSMAALEHEDELLRHYFDAWTAAMTEAAAPAYSFQEFQRHYELALLEYARVLISRFWKGMTPISCAAKGGNSNCGLGYRSLPHVLRLVERMDQALQLVESERGTTVAP
ncbi:TPA: hypothetical protein N0F65_010421 [Lagenidium giganteum]|uniref:3'(2'),5'-bisphosphate nucleotidase 1 n=1 Tax=Lagenidium giganteum TaxID=4803 RepID=A0AAV2YTH9_9STRA|nr:TPA: hypothetical protein N0F65_010421 [Lagenidium giganteum]